MAEAGDSQVQSKKRRSTSDRGIQFSLNVQLPRNQESRLLGIKDRIGMAKTSLNLSKGTSSTQNADLLEALLLAFEEKMQRRKEVSVVSSLLSNQWSPAGNLSSTPSSAECPQSRPTPIATSTPRSRMSLDFDGRVSESLVPLPHTFNVSSSSATVPSQKFQISTLATWDDPIYLASEGALRSLFSFFTSKLSAKCCFCGKLFDIDTLSFTRQGHEVSVNMSCLCGGSIKWLSSPIMGGTIPKYYVNMRMIHGVLSCGLTETQYSGVCQAANIGSEGDKTFDTVLKKLQYMAVVKEVCSESMLGAQEEAKNRPGYHANGECVITDARHDSSRSAAHTTVSALSFSTKKVVGVLNWSRASDVAAVSREVPMTKELVTLLIETQGAKSVTKALKKVASGPLRDQGTKWFSELSDKVKSTRTHIYFCMKNSSGNEDDFRETLLTVVDHYQDNHNKCSEGSRCKSEGYIMSKKLLTESRAIAAYKKAIMGTSIYRHATDYMRCRETFWIETLHTVMLIYVPKRIHFGDNTYNMRVELAVLDWNENVNREVSSLQMYQHARHPNRLAETRVLVEKTFNFREVIWSRFFKLNN
ncbi:uncharacterized protein [Montipora foliosa]|uniref:uncharacterized protein n=1 Tax=Montipora foliosa TaxID=591990 RepID=UPI0035F16BAD